MGRFGGQIISRFITTVVVNGGKRSRDIIGHDNNNSTYVQVVKTAKFEFLADELCT